MPNFLNTTRTIKILACALLFSMLGCSRYSVSINENVVYVPTQYFSDYKISDVALDSCVKSTIAEKKLMRAEQLKTLLCPGGDIVSLKGLEKFSAIEYLGLDDNMIEQIDSLKSLKKLKQLSIKNNRIVNFSTLWGLEQLGLVEAKGNSGANCKTFEGIAASAKVQLPEHCKA